MLLIGTLFLVPVHIQQISKLPVSYNAEPPLMVIARFMTGENLHVKFIGLDQFCGYHIRRLCETYSEMTSIGAKLLYFLSESSRYSRQFCVENFLEGVLFSSKRVKYKIYER